MATTPADQLPDAEKRRLEAEEIYRREVRLQLERLDPPSGAWKKFFGAWLKFFNSSLGIWVLSAVFITAGGAYYTKREEAVKEKEKKEEEVKAQKIKTDDLVARLDLEISYRLSGALLNLATAEGRITQAAAEPAIAAARKDRQRRRAEHIEIKPSPMPLAPLLVPLSLPTTPQRPPLFPEFNSYSGWALVAERRRHTPGDNERLTRILARGPMLLVELETGNPRKLTPGQAAGELIEIMKMPAWSRAFPYTDCSKANPFC